MEDNGHTLNSLKITDLYTEDECLKGNTKEGTIRPVEDEEKVLAARQRELEFKLHCVTQQGGWVRVLAEETPSNMQVHTHA